MTAEERIARLRAALADIREVAYEHAEGGYGDDGQRGNDWMNVLVQIDFVLAKDEGRAPW